MLTQILTFLMEYIQNKNCLGSNTNHHCGAVVQKIWSVTWFNFMKCTHWQAITYKTAAKLLVEMLGFSGGQLKLDFKQPHPIQLFSIASIMQLEICNFCFTNVVVSPLKNDNLQCELYSCYVGTSFIGLDFLRKENDVRIVVANMKRFSVCKKDNFNRNVLSCIYIQSCNCSMQS